jgi:hypothetical protein
MITLRFVAADEADWASRIIRSAQLGFAFSHVEARLDDGSLLGARFDGGVAVRQPGYDAKTMAREEYVGVATPQLVELSFYAALRGELGKPYDVAAIGAMLDGVIAGDDDKEWAATGAAWICSSLQFGIANATNVWRAPINRVRLVTPEICYFTAFAVGGRTLAAP